MSARTEIAKALKPWLIHSSWSSEHTLDASRFYRAMAQVIANAGTVWTESEFQNAVFDVIGWEQKATFEELVNEYTSVAMNIRDYEAVRPELLFPDALCGSYVRRP
ncbi:hypothetical protein K2O51_32980 (plasmid) [Cupriavidus pinatubonensis]|uniref:hypothetical protein n=1 Tax=Cupriavidus pinatubonensis TaxID=248026 RepID=UPI001C72A94F|nr:hypothetical protein [Cupriavidus pinatubonensis]QYY34173.1 hypothetical protein K2O51_32980 [Cupriavidus pinatubonensis]